MGRAVRRPSPEVALLLAAARRELDEHGRALLAEAIERGVDWSIAIPLALGHGLLPLLYHHLSRTAEARRQVSCGVLTAMRTIVLPGLRHSMELATELGHLLRLFSARDVGVIPLKGPTLAETLYGSVALRSSADLDILVASSDLDRAHAALELDGYVLRDRWTPAQAALARRVGHHVAYVHPSRACTVELHHRLTPPIGQFDLGSSEVADQLCESTFGGSPVTVLAPEALLVYLCVHGAGHAWARLEWIGGVAELLRSGRVVDWLRVKEIARRFGATRRLAAGMYLADTLLPTPLSHFALTPPDWRVRRAADSVIERLLARPGDEPTGWERLAFLRGTDPDLATMIDRHWHILFAPHPADLAAFPLPRPFRWLYGVSRPLRLSWRAARRAIG